MSAQEVSAAEIPAAQVPADTTTSVAKEKKAKKTVTVPAKIARKLETLEAKYLKVVEEKKKLKVELSTLKSANSRIRRIPKTTVAPATEA